MILTAPLIEPFEGDSYAFLATLYKNKDLPLAVRLDAAKTAIAYERPRLSNVAMTTKSLDDMMTAEEIFEFRDQLKAFIAESRAAESRANAEGDRADSAEDGDTAPSGALLS